MVQRPPMWFWGWFMKLAPLDTADNYDQIDEAPLVYLKLLRAFYLRFHKLSPLFAEAFPHLGTLLCVPRFHRDLQRLGSPSRENWGFKVSFDGTLAQMRWRNVFESNQISEFLSPRNLLKFIGASVFAAGHALQCIHKGKAAAWLGKTGKPKSPTNSAVTQNPCGTVTSFFHFTSGYSRLMYAFWFYWRLLWPILWQMILVKTQICWMAWNLFLLRRGFSVQQSKYGTPNGAILEDHRSHVWRDSLW